MKIYDYPKELNAALIYKKEGKTFEEYEKDAQNLLQPIECQIFWVLAEDVMDIVAEEVNKAGVDTASIIAEKEREINKLKKRIDKMSGNFDISDEGFGFKAIGQVLVTVSKDSVRYDGAVTDDVITAKTYDDKSSTVSGRGLATSIEKSQALGNWFIVKDLDTGSKKVYRLNNIDGYTELRYPMVTEPSPIPEDPWESWDPDERMPMSKEEAELHRYSWDEETTYGNNGGGF